MQKRKESLDVASPGQLWFPSLEYASSDSCMVFRKIAYWLCMAVPHLSIALGALLWRLQYWTPCFVVSTRGWTPLFFLCFDHGWLFLRNPINKIKKSVVEGIFEETIGTSYGAGEHNWPHWHGAEKFIAFKFYLSFGHHFCRDCSLICYLPKVLKVKLCSNNNGEKTPVMLVVIDFS